MIEAIEHDIAVPTAISLLQSVRHLAPDCERQHLLREFYVTIRAALEAHRVARPDTAPSVN